MMDEIIRSAEDAASGPATASSRLKSRVFSKLVALEQSEGPLRVLSESRAAGEQLCVFEKIVAAVPSQEARNPCAVCHARVLGENVEHAPIFWPGCAYSRFCGH